MAKTREAVPRAVRDVVLREFNHRCAKCAADRPQLHHIDEDPSNNDPLNIIPLCPNCHLVDQHDASNAVPAAKLKFFRRHKHKRILSPRFDSLFKPMAFLSEVDGGSPSVLEPAHLAGLWRVTTPREPVDATLSALGRSLAEYEAVVR